MNRIPLIGAKDVANLRAGPEATMPSSSWPGLSGIRPRRQGVSAWSPQGLRRRMGNAAVLRARQFDWDNVAKQWEQLLLGIHEE